MRIFSFRRLRRLFSFASMGINRRGGRGVRRRHNAFQQRRDAFSSWRLNSEQLEPKRLLSVNDLILPPSQTYAESETLTFRVDFTETVTLTDVDFDPATVPSINLTIGSNGRAAEYASGDGTSSLFFNYTVLSTDEDIDGIEVLSPIQLNGDTISDSSGALTAGDLDISSVGTDISGPLINIKVDGIAPTVPGTMTIPSPGNYSPGEVLNFSVTFDEAVSTTDAILPVVIGSNTRSATLTAPVTSGTTLTFEYTIQPADKDIDGISVDPANITGSVTDNAGNAADLSTATAPSTAGVLVNNPAVTDVTVTATTYGDGDVISLTTVFNQPVDVTGTPRIALVIGGSSVFADYASGSGTAALVFNYTVQTSDLDTDGIIVSTPIDPNGGAIEDADGNAATLDFTPPTTTGVLVDAVAPVANAVTPPTNGYYSTGEDLDFDVIFDGTVDVAGTPVLPLTIGAATPNASYISGSGTDTLRFRYTIQSTDKGNGISVDPTNITGTITDAAGNAADFGSTPAPSTTGVIVNAAVIDSVTASADGDYEVGDTITLTANFSQPVD
ncbi:hypothetical protein N9B71_06205, partial [Pirellulales bacterium]|nr:hypothetical protein [Pirellulales bacterium]